MTSSAARAATPAVAAGGLHTCALTASGGVFCWGANNTGQLGDNSVVGRVSPVPVTGLSSGATAIAAGANHSCAITSSGGVKCWGFNVSGQLGDNTIAQKQVPVDVLGLTSGVQAITAGTDHTCALTTGGGVKCWGNNANGQLGDNSTAQRNAPVNVNSLGSGVTAIAAGGAHTCALTSGGGVKCWGSNAGGQIGDNSIVQRPVPVDVIGLGSGVAAIDAGGLHTCAITSGGGVKCWGLNATGQIGDSSLTPRLQPVDVSGLASGVDAIALGGSHSCALVDGVVECWGSNATGQIGDGTPTHRLAPVPAINLPGGIAAIAAGNGHTCAVTSGGGVKCWGDNGFAQLGGGIGTQQPTPVDVDTLSSGIIAVTAGGNHSCGITTGGGVKCWGSNGNGQLGDSTTTSRPGPVGVTGLASGIVAITVGSAHTCALTTGGGMKCWGANTNGELGDNSNTQRTAPVDVPGLTSGVTSIAAGGNHTCAVAGGGVKCWGANAFGQLGDTSTAPRNTPGNVSNLTTGAAAVTAGNLHTCALTTGGAARCWGNNGNGQLGDSTVVQKNAPAQVMNLTSGVIALTAGSSHTCALLTSGGARCWGANQFGQLGDSTVGQRLVPTDVTGMSSGVAALNAGGLHTCAVTSAGGAKCWGYNAAGQLGDGTTTQRLAAVDVVGLTSGMAATAGGLSHTCGRTAAGGVKCWGYGYHGQLGDGTFNFYSVPQFVVNLNLNGGASVVSSLNPSTYGDSVTFTATVTGDAPTGTVQFRDSSSTISGCGSVMLDGAGGASCTTAALTIGAHGITVVYSGDANNPGVISPPITQTINALPTTTSLQTSLNPSQYGQSVTFTATVNGGNPTGTVNFKDGASTITGCGTVAVSGGQAQCTTFALTRATHAITAIYSGDSGYVGSTSGAISQVVDIAATTTTLGSSPNPSTYPQSITFTASINGLNVGGNVTFRDGGVAICAASPVIAGSAQCTRNDLAGGTHSITAEYNGDANHLGSTSNALSQVVNTSATATTLSSTGSPTKFGQSVTFTATISGQQAGGTVAFNDGASPLSGCGAVHVMSNVATCTTTSLAVGSHVVTAVYNGDGNNAGSTSLPLSHVVSKAQASATVTSSPNPTTFNQNATFTAQITGQSPAGSVEFKAGGSTIAGCSAVGVSFGIAQCAVSTLAVGSHSITAVYSGDVNNTGHTSTPITHVVGKAATMTNLGSMPNPSTFGQSATFTALVNGQSPTGSVGFFDGGITIAGCGARPVMNGQAVCTTSSLAVATHSITATYGGDTNNAASTSGTVVQAVDRAPSTTTVGSSMNPSGFGANVTFTATVSGQSPAGTIDFRNGAALIAGCGGVALSGGTAQCSTSALAVGAHGITATYGGDGNNAGSTSMPLSQVVATAPSIVAIGSSANPSVFPQDVTFTATVSGQSPTGTIDFRNGATSIAGCASVMLSGGQAQCAAAALPVGTHGITAIYSGDGNNAGGTSGALSQIVGKAASSTSLVSSLNPSRLGNSVTLTATVTGQSPAGTVEFRNGMATIAGCEAIALSGGTAQCTTGALPVGTHALTAVYGGDGHNNGSTSDALSQAVDIALTTTTLGTSGTPMAAGSSVTFTASINGQAPGGTVDFIDGGVAIAGCTAVPVAAGQAQCTMGTMTIGTHSMSAVYSGDARNAGSTSNTVLQTIFENIVVVASMVTLSANGPIHRGQKVTISAVVSGGASPTGTVDVSGAGANCVITLANGAGSCELTPTIVGVNRMVTGNYAGDAGHAPSSGTVQLTVKSTLDVDDNGVPDSLTDGLLAMRYLFGLRGNALTANAIGEGASATTPAAIADYLEQVVETLDIDGNGSVDALTDGLMVIRYLFGLRGAALIANAIGAGATRMTAADIEIYLSSLIE